MLVRPIAGIGENDSGLVSGAGCLELSLRLLEHRRQRLEVAALGDHLGGNDDLLLVGDDLGVVALQVAARASCSSSLGRSC